MTAYLMPIVQPFVDNNGQPLAGGLVYTCIAGAASYTGSNLQTTWTDTAGTVANTNPIVLDSSGRCSMYGGTLPYKIYVFNSNNVPVGNPIDNVYPLSFSQSIYTGISNLSPNKNLIDNASFNVWQRGTSVAVPAGSRSCTADRWASAPSTGTPDLTGSSDTMTINGVSQPCLKVTNTSSVASFAAGQYVQPCYQELEGFSVYPYLQAGGAFTVSFWFAASATGNYAVALNNTDNTYSYVHLIKVASANTPQQYSFTVYIPSSGVWNCPNSNAAGMRLRIGSIGGSAYNAPSSDTWTRGNFFTTSTCANWCASSWSYIKIAQVRIEQGTSLGVWNPLKYDKDLRRYQYFLPSWRGNLQPLGIAQATGATTAQLNLLFYSLTRVPPTGIFLSSPSHINYVQASGTAIQATGLSFNLASTGALGLLNVSGLSGLTAGQSGNVYSGDAAFLLLATGAELL